MLEEPTGPPTLSGPPVSLMNTVMYAYHYELYVRHTSAYTPVTLCITLWQCTGTVDNLGDFDSQGETRGGNAEVTSVRDATMSTLT